MSIKLTINELSKIVNTPASTIRYYCNSGFIEPSGMLKNKYRYFTIDKIEEIRLINYLRYLDIPLKDIKKHLENRDFDDYEALLIEQQININEKIEKLNLINQRIEKRLELLNYIKDLPTLGKVHKVIFPTRGILRIDLDINTQMDFEVALLNFETLGNLPSSLIVGDQGFIVDLNKIKTRTPVEFSGMYMLGDFDKEDYKDLYHELPQGEWLTIYFRGDHYDAPKHYQKLMEYAEINSLNLMDFALERVLIDNFISDDPNNYITEIQIPLK